MEIMNKENGILMYNAMYTDNKKTLYINRTEFYNWYWTPTEHSLWGEDIADDLFSFGKVIYSDEGLLDTFLKEEDTIPIRLILNPEDIDDLNEIEDGALKINVNKYNYEFKEVKE